MAAKLNVINAMNSQASGITRPHYLLELNSISLRTDAGDLAALPPEWVKQALHETHFVVVRRASAVEGLVPIGVRGRTREQRFAAWVPADTVQRVITPADLLNEYRRSTQMPGTSHGAFESLFALQKQWSGKNFLWGPGGSVGFELACKIPTVTAFSDLDIVIYADEPIAGQELRKICMDRSIASANIDIQVETPTCGFSLAEYVREYPHKILLKTASGPVMAVDPWDHARASSAEPMSI